jgi:peptidoglycan/LPS O-acetylase OafA/YrhL
LSLSFSNNRARRISNLDGLRFFAAFIVLFVHIQVIKKIFGLQALNSRFIDNASHISVTFFFVLSGFLITYFLIREKTENKNISISKFYKRRILRIWPLYYLLLCLSFFIFPYFTLFKLSPGENVLDFHFTAKLIGCLLFFPNYTSHIFGSLSYMDITWSLAVEEFFYITFPLFIFFTPLKKMENALFLLLLLFIALSFLPFIFSHLLLLNTSFVKMTNMYIGKYRLYAFVAGALSSYIFFYTHSLPSYLDFLKNKTFSSLLLAIFFTLIFCGVTFSIVNHQLYSIFFTILLFSISSSGIKPFFINNAVINYCGKISYGIYMLHPLAIIITLKLFQFTLSPRTNTLKSFPVDIVAILMSVAIGTLSYECFEKIFLKKVSTIDLPRGYNQPR